MEGNHGGPPGPSGGDNVALDTVQAEQRRALARTFVAMQGASVQGNLVLVRRLARLERQGSGSVPWHSTRSLRRVLPSPPGELPAERQPGAGPRQECSLAGVFAYRLEPCLAVRSSPQLLS